MQIVSKETICMKYQILFSGKNKKKFFLNVVAEIFPSMLSIKEFSCLII